MKPQFQSDSDSFIISDYNRAAPYSSFLPAIAGLRGKPMWVFYTNRGQGIAAFGVDNKDGAMLEFLPANKAYQAVPTLGFRTFIHLKGGQRDIFEPFAMSSSGRQVMTVRPYEVEFTETNEEIGLECNVLTFGIPGESCPLIARVLTLKNLSRHSIECSVIDGLPRVVPWGMKDNLVKTMSRTIEAFAEVLNLNSNVPVFKLKCETDDRPEVVPLLGGFFSFALRGDQKLSPIVVDPSVIFDQDTSFSFPSAFHTALRASTESQAQANIMPCSFSTSSSTVPAAGSITLVSYYGFANLTHEAKEIADKVLKNPHYLQVKRAEMQREYELLVGNLGIQTADPIFDQYCHATFMDNALRGGVPVSFGKSGRNLHVFSRKHGDMERDYNAFQISGTYFSQGNANFRDVNQNRRCDLFFSPHVGAANVEFFFNMQQIDGYNPLVVNPTRLQLDEKVLDEVELISSAACTIDKKRLLATPVLLGEIYSFLKKYLLKSNAIEDVFEHFVETAGLCPTVSHGEGYWVDHWTYNLDHLDTYLAVFPDKLRWILFEKSDFTFFDSDHYVRPRTEKYLVSQAGKLRQYGAVAFDKKKKSLIESRSHEKNSARSEQGQGTVFYTTLFIKLLNLAFIKFSTLDHFGVGIEMEADKPGWCDALNGLPGLIGSSSHEVFELDRLLHFLEKVGLPAATETDVTVPQELSTLIYAVQAALQVSSSESFLKTWDRLATAREEFRAATFLGFDGGTVSLPLKEIKVALESMRAVLAIAKNKIVDPSTGLPTSYFYYQVAVDELAINWKSNFSVLPWKQHRLVPFLEGAVHALKNSSVRSAQDLYTCVQASELYDSSLGMYRLNTSLESESDELGRIRVFSPGWLENASIFLHMHYKFLLELLKADLTDEFYQECSSGLIPFRSAEQYGRPLFENSSFIASSAFPVKAVHGQGFVARLSGATAELMSMLYLVFFGKAPIVQRATGEISFSPKPRIPSSWFIQGAQTDSLNDSVTIKLFGVPVTYINPKRLPTFGADSVCPAEFEWQVGSDTFKREGRDLEDAPTRLLREGLMKHLIVHLR